MPEMFYFFFCSSGIQHQVRGLKWHEAERVGHRRAEEDPLLLEEVLGQHGSVGTWHQNTLTQPFHHRVHSLITERSLQQEKDLKIQNASLEVFDIRLL